MRDPRATLLELSDDDEYFRDREDEFDDGPEEDKPWDIKKYEWKTFRIDLRKWGRFWNPLDRKVAVDIILTAFDYPPGVDEIQDAIDSLEHLGDLTQPDCSINPIKQWLDSDQFFNQQTSDSNFKPGSSLGEWIYFPGRRLGSFNEYDEIRTFDFQDSPRDILNAPYDLRPHRWGESLTRPSTSLEAAEYALHHLSHERRTVRAIQAYINKVENGSSNYNFAGRKGKITVLLRQHQLYEDPSDASRGAIIWANPRLREIFNEEKSVVDPWWKEALGDTQLTSPVPGDTGTSSKPFLYDSDVLADSESEARPEPKHSSNKMGKKSSSKIPDLLDPELNEQEVSVRERIITQRTGREWEDGYPGLRPKGKGTSASCEYPYQGHPDVLAENITDISTGPAWYIKLTDNQVAQLLIAKAGGKSGISKHELNYRWGADFDTNGKIKTDRPSFGAAYQGTEETGFHKADLQGSAVDRAMLVRSNLPRHFMSCGQLMENDPEYQASGGADVIDLLVEKDTKISELQASLAEKEKTTVPVPDSSLMVSVMEDTRRENETLKRKVSDISSELEQQKSQGKRPRVIGAAPAPDSNELGEVKQENLNLIAQIKINKIERDRENAMANEEITRWKKNYEELRIHFDLRGEASAQGIGVGRIAMAFLHLLRDGIDTKVQAMEKHLAGLSMTKLGGVYDTQGYATTFASMATDASKYFEEKHSWLSKVSPENRPYLEEEHFRTAFSTINGTIPDEGIHLCDEELSRLEELVAKGEIDPSSERIKEIRGRRAALQERKSQDRIREDAANASKLLKECDLFGEDLESREIVAKRKWEILSATDRANAMIILRKKELEFADLLDEAVYSVSNLDLYIVNSGKTAIKRDTDRYYETACFEEEIRARLPDYCDNQMIQDLHRISSINRNKGIAEIASDFQQEVEILKYYCIRTQRAPEDVWREIRGLKLPSITLLKAHILGTLDEMHKDDIEATLLAKFYLQAGWDADDAEGGDKEAHDADLDRYRTRSAKFAAEHGFERSDPAAYDSFNKQTWLTEIRSLENDLLAKYKTPGTSDEIDKMASDTAARLVARSMEKGENAMTRHAKFQKQRAWERYTQLQSTEHELDPLDELTPRRVHLIHDWWKKHLIGTFKQRTQQCKAEIALACKESERRHKDTCRKLEWSRRIPKHFQYFRYGFDIADDDSNPAPPAPVVDTNDYLGGESS